MTTNEKLIYLMESIRIMAQAIDNEAPDLALRKIRILVEQMDEWDGCEMYGWTRIKDKLPNHGQQVALITTRRFWNVPDGVPDAHVTATGYLAETSGRNYWAIFGERGMELNDFTHWMPLQNPAMEE